jgi:L-fuculose-phosphate aldolase
MSDEECLRQAICEIGRRVYARQFVSGNAGNISCRLSNSVILSTPTLICKGFMQPDDLCTLDLNGKQLSGQRPVTSEIRLHLEVYKHNPNVKAVVHCHPPHATAFAVAREDIPIGVLPEVDVFLGKVPRARYATPGDAAFAQTIRPFIGKANTVILSNHGVVSWGQSVEQAYWHAEILDSYCHVLLLARQLGHVEQLSEEEMRELQELRRRFGAGPDGLCNPSGSGSVPS